MRPWQHVLNPLSGYLVLAERLWDDPAAAGGWNFGPRESDARPVGWIVERLAELWAGGVALGARPRPAPARGALPQLDSSRGARAARLGAALGPRRGARAIVEWYAALRAGERHARASRSRQIEAFQAAARAARLRAHDDACRFCGTPLEAVFADLGMSPLANSLPDARAGQRDGAVLSAARARLRRAASSSSSRSTSRPDHIFSDYAYFSSYSSSLARARARATSRR